SPSSSRTSRTRRGAASAPAWPICWSSSIWSARPISAFASTSPTRWCPPAAGRRSCGPRSRTCGPSTRPTPKAAAMRTGRWDAAPSTGGACWKCWRKRATTAASSWKWPAARRRWRSRLRRCRARPAPVHAATPTQAHAPTPTPTHAATPAHAPTPTPTQTQMETTRRRHRSGPGRRSDVALRTPDVNDEHDKALMARIAWLYYNHGLTQQAIGDMLGFSRNKVLRLLARARDEGIVQIRVDHPSIRYMELEERLTAAFGFREALVVPSGDTPEQTLEALGQFGAMYLERTVAPGDAVGTAWGVTLRQVARHLRPRPLSDVTVVQLLGGLHADGLINPLDVARVVAEKFEGRLQMLYTP